MYQLRPYQQQAIAMLRQAIARLKQNGTPGRVILVSPTGSGKTVVASHIIAGAVAKGKSVLFLAHRRELIYQCAGKLSENGIDYGIILAGEKDQMNRAARVQVASKDTLYSRAIRNERMLLPPADLVVCDEAHRSTGGPTWLKLIEAYPQATLLGLTATPARKNGKALGDVWQELVIVASYEELIASGALVPTRVFAPSQPDLKGLKISGGDYQPKDLERRVNKAKLVGDIFTTWVQVARERPTVVFASGVSHSLHIQERFEHEGIRCAHIDGKTDAQTRWEALWALEHGDIDVLTNCAVLTEGWDCPPVACAILARPTKSLILYRQMAGRIQRPAPGKTDALIIDHSGAVYEHGFPDEDIDWVLETNSKEERVKAKEERQERMFVCDECKFVYRADKCPNCGALPPQRKPRYVKAKPGQLTEVKRRHALKESTLSERQRAWDASLGIAIRKNQAVGAAAHIYKNRYGVWPRGLKKLPHGKPQWSLKALDFYRRYILE